MRPNVRSIRVPTTTTTMPRPKSGAWRIRLLTVVALLGASWNAAANESLLSGPAAAAARDDAVAGFRPAVQLAAVDADAPAPSNEETIAPKWKGYSQGEFAYTYPSPAHWSKLKGRLEVEVEGRFSEQMRWKLSGGASYDAVFDVTDFYPGDVAHGQRQEFIARENYLDYSAGDFDFRFGRQHIIWGSLPMSYRQRIFVNSFCRTSTLSASHNGRRAPSISRTISTPRRCGYR